MIADGDLCEQRCTARGGNAVDARHVAGQPVAAAEHGLLEYRSLAVDARQPDARDVLPVAQEGAARRRRGRADRSLGQQHLDEAERHQRALSVEELEVDRREARIAVEPGEARLEPQRAAIRQGREQPDLGDPVRIGDHVARDLGRPAPELVVRDRVRRRVEQPLVQQRARHAPLRRVEHGRGAVRAHAQLAEVLEGRAVKERARGVGIVDRRGRVPVEGRQGERRGRVGGEEHAGARDRLEAREPGISRLAPGEQRRCMHVAAAGDLGAQPHRPAREGQPAQHLHVAQRDDRAPRAPRHRAREAIDHRHHRQGRHREGRAVIAEPRVHRRIEHLVVARRARRARRRRRSACRGFAPRRSACRRPTARRRRRRSARARRRRPR